MDAQSSLKDNPAYDSAYAAALRQYHAYVAPEVGLYRGTEYVDYTHTVQQGQPFFGPQVMRYGSLSYNGVVYDNVQMMYDLIKDQLVIKGPYNVFNISLYMDLIDSFALDGHLFIPVRDSVAPDYIRRGFCEPLYRGRLILLKKERKFIHQNITITPDNIAAFIDSSTTYYLRKDGGYQQVDTKKQLLKALKDKRADVRRFMRKSKLRWRANREQLLKLVSTWYDSANH